ncbi:MAG: thiosulfate oxidation carrier complex protein SoxZ [Rhodospirillales bacterium]|nr:thiosulfate oxidation carrier complex protein SoxZ [Rhodospirillales bacterium]
MASRADERRLKVPEQAKQGEVIVVKTLARHPMEPGVRRDPDSGVIYPRFIIQSVVCRFNGVEVFQARWYSGVSENPFLSFPLRVDESGVIEVEWIDDYLKSTTRTAFIQVFDAEGREVWPVTAEAPSAVA